ncbi:MAG: type II secretion system protein N [Pseudomonadota bacterium]
MRAFFITLIVIVVLTAGIISQLPMSLATDRLRPYAEFGEVRGTIWNGEIDDIEVNGEVVGDAAIALHFLPLLSREAVADLSFSGRGLDGAGTAGFDGTLITLEDAVGRADLARFGMVDAMGQTLRGTVDASVRKIEFSLEEGCKTADLSAETDTISRSLGVYAGRGFMMSGDGYCDGEDLVVPLSGEGEDAALNAELRINQRGQYRSRLAVTPKNDDLGRFLQSMGFTRDGDVYVVERGGRLEDNL